MYESSWREQERLKDQIDKLRGDKEGMEKELEGIKSISLKLQADLSDKTQAVETLEKKLEREMETSSRTKLQLENEKASRNRTCVKNKAQVLADRIVV